MMLERLTEPLHLNLASVFVAMFGSFRLKVAFDLVYKQPYAWGILRAAEQARSTGQKRVTVVEAGVAAGAGLMSMCRISQRVTKATGIDVSVVGLDGGNGMPASRDYRDHPDMYLRGDYPMDEAALRRVLPTSCSLLVGPLKDTVNKVLEELSGPIGFVAVDLDYFSSTVEVLNLFMGPVDCYLTIPAIYFDDVYSERHNLWCGELAAINDFNLSHGIRKIDRYRFLRKERIFKNAPWIDQIYIAHLLDHPWRLTPYHPWSQRILGNYFLSEGTTRDEIRCQIPPDRKQSLDLVTRC
jgi:hypothetical protein